MASGSHYPEILADVAVAVATSLTDEGIPPAQASDAGFAAAEQVRQRWGGQVVYIPEGAELARSKRDAIIVQEFEAGRATAAELAERFQLSVRRVRQIIRQARRRAKAPP